ncbi:MAG TPA: DMT family transporter [Xanthobacteraceae bacterium]|jgi:drug/metabolite transporter (DMT)-like permease|nr:DMT family transporter [Xanthobacteraceae bacterium]
MIAGGFLWAIFTVIAAAGQTARNALQRGLTQTIGTVGATLVRFLFGLPFGVLFLLIVWWWTKEPLPALTTPYLLWAFAGAVCQIAATALMLMAMNERSFVVTIAYIKTEPVLVAVFGLMFLGDKLTLASASAIVIATIGVMMMSWTKSANSPPLRPLLYGLTAAALFGLSAVTFRGAIRSLGLENFVMAATFTLAVGLLIQTLLLTVYLVLFDRRSLYAILREWRPSILAGFLGALASQFWFLGFSLTSAANVRTLALVEVLFAQFVTKGIGEKTSAREIIGILMVVSGIIFLLWAH